MIRFVSWSEDRRGHAVLWLPLFWRGWRFGFIILEPFIGGWQQQVFVGFFRKSGS